MPCQDPRGTVVVVHYWKTEIVEDFQDIVVVDFRDIVEYFRNIVVAVGKKCHSLVT